MSPMVVCAIVRLLWYELKIEKAREWYAHVVTRDDCGPRGEDKSKAKCESCMAHRVLVRCACEGSSYSDR